jgi:hypothetical protein
MDESFQRAFHQVVAALETAGSSGRRHARLPPSLFVSRWIPGMECLLRVLGSSAGTGSGNGLVVGTPDVKINYIA